jgi:hypothetical protein
MKYVLKSSNLTFIHFCEVHLLYESLLVVPRVINPMGKSPMQLVYWNIPLAYLYWKYVENIVAYRSVARQRRRNKQRDSSRCYATAR